MAKKKTSTKEYEIEGHSVRIVEGEDRRNLLIDGRPYRFFETDDGFTLRDDAYATPRKSLLDAAKALLRRQKADEAAGS